MPLWGGIVSLAIALLVGGAAASAAEDAGSAPPPAYSAKGADSCLGCHDDAPLLELFRTKHARPHDDHGPFGHGGLQCEACHGPGRAHIEARGKQPAGIVDFGPRAHASVAQQNARCLNCHQSNTAHEWQGSVHATHNVPCTGCHTLHAVHDAVRVTDTQVEVCTRCHEAQHSDLFKPYRHPMREGKMACTACHQPHGASTPAQLVANTVTETCTRCHAEYRGPFLWEHQPVSENCANCHDAHGSVQPALLKMRPPFLCQSCHDGSGHPSVTNGPGGLPGGGAPSPFLLAGGCINCHSQVHGSNHPSGRALMR